MADRVVTHFFVALAVLCIACGCNEPSTVDLATYCSEGLALVIEGQGETGTMECVPPAEATERAVSEARRPSDSEENDDYLNRSAQWEEERDEEYRREMEEIRKDDIRSCILAGNNADLCELDPGDPYGTGDQQ